MLQASDDFWADEHETFVDVAAQDIKKSAQHNKGNNVHVSFDITCPSDVTKKELEAYLKYELQIVDELPCDNPLDAHDICVLDVRNLVIKK